MGGPQYEFPGSDLEWIDGRLRARDFGVTLKALFVVLLTSLGLISVSCSGQGIPSAPAQVVDVELDSSSGAAVFAENCAVCHSLPILSSLFEQNRGRAPGFVYDALTEGNMRRMGAGLDPASRRAVAEFFTGVRFDSEAGKRNFEVSPRCSSERMAFDWGQDQRGRIAGGDWAYPNWGGSLRNLRRAAESAALNSAASDLTRSDLKELEVAWVVAFPEASQLRSQPTAAGGALFAGSHNGSVYALDQATGCTRWHFKAATEVRTAVTIARMEGSSKEGPESRSSSGVRAFFADRAANVYALDASTGRLLWKTSVDPHLNAATTGSLSVHEGRVYVPVSSNDDINSLDPGFPCCTHHGAVVAVDALSGEIVWRTPTVAEAPEVVGQTGIGTDVWGPSGASVWNTPTVAPELGLLFVGAGNNHSRPATAMSDSVLALDLRTGDVKWTYQAQAGDAWNAACLFGNRMSCPDPEGPDTDFGATTMLVRVEGKDRLLAGQKSGVLHALDPATGAVAWKRRISPGGAEGGIRYGMSSLEGAVYVPVADDARDGSDASISSSTSNSMAYPGPGLFALSSRDGSPLWSATAKDLCAGEPNCNGAIAAPPFAVGDLLIAAGLEGVLYALDRETGEVLWRFDTAREFETLKGTRTRGGGIAGTAGPLFANGRLFVSSGYGQAQRPGNALIALAPRGLR